MFTGLVREVGRVSALARRAGITTLEIDAPLTARPPQGPPPAVGDSIAVNGICLTLVGIAGRRLRVEATLETRRVTTLSDWVVGTSVHLEPSLRVGDPLGGHFVLGHVDGTGRLAALARQGGAAWMTVVLPRDLARGLLPKGSIAVDGVSLTLDEGPFDDRFTVTLIPHTLRATRFAALRAGATVNLELDILTKTALRLGADRAPRSGQAGSTPTMAGNGQRAAGASGLALEAIRARGWSRGNRHG
jgi:riboflavin synthase alpha subunit